VSGHRRTQTRHEAAVEGGEGKGSTPALSSQREVNWDASWAVQIVPGKESETCKGGEGKDRDCNQTGGN